MKKISRVLWDLQRFGLTPSKMLARITHGTSPRIFLTSIPKAGTHLVERALCLDPLLRRKMLPTLREGNSKVWGGLENLPSILRKLKAGEMVVTHIPYSERARSIVQEAGVKCIFVLRDPLDVVISAAHYVGKNSKHRLYSKMVSKRFQERLELSIRGDTDLGYQGIEETLRRFSGWLDSGSFAIKYEDLINSELRKTRLWELYEYLDMDRDLSTLERISDRLVSSDSPTFRSGKTGEWRQVFDESTLALFREHVDSGVLRKYGYEAP